MKSILEQNGGFFIEFEMLAEMKKALEQLFASGAVVIVAAMAKACGELFFRKVKSQNLGVEEALERLRQILAGWNWGEFTATYVNADEGTGRFYVKNSLETRTGWSGCVGCYFLSNFMAGFLSELLDRNIAVKERKCASLGGNVCEFEFQAFQNGE